MNLKNILRNGDYVMVVPFGGHITLQYDDQGNLEKAFKGWDTIDDITHDIGLFDPKIDKFPRQIVARTVNGTTWVYGVLYTASNITSEFDNVDDAIIDAYIAQPNMFAFFACTAKSTAYSFNGLSSLTTWLRANNFNVLNGFLVGSNYSDSILKHFVSSDQFPFKCPELASYYIINGKDTQFVETKVQAHVVDSVTTEMSESGQILGKIVCKDGKEILVDYSVLVDFNILKNTCLLMDDNGTIQYSYPTDNRKRKPKEDTLVCKYCGKPIKVESGSTTICENEQCVSRMYPNIKHLCKVLELPVITYAQFTKHIKDGTFTYLCDIFLLDEYKDTTVHTTLAKLLDSVVPVQDVRFRSIFNVFANNCSNNPHTFLYYLKNPHKISSELGLSEYDGCNELVKWLSVPENEMVIETMLNTDNFIFDVTDKKFDGDPILRGKKIFVTGVFNHGNISDIMDILRSYSAEVVTTYDDSVTTVLVGDIPENVSGVSIRKAKKNNISVFQEEGFFKLYDIDEDLKKNL